MLIKFDVSEVHMVDMGQVAGGFQFEAECVDKEQKISQVRIITNDITTNDKLDSVTVYWVDDLLHMHVWIDRYVYDEWWNVPDRSAISRKKSISMWNSIVMEFRQ